MQPFVERRSVLPARLVALVWALALVLAATARGGNVATTISASPNCISPGGTTNVKVIGKATANDTNAHLFLCCPPGTAFGSQTVSSTGGAPTLGYCDTGYGNCQYAAGGPFDGVGIQCNGAGSFPQNSTVTMVVPVTAPANFAATSFNCRAIGFDSASIPPVPAFLTVPTQCTSPPTLHKEVSYALDDGTWWARRTGATVQTGVRYANSSQNTQGSLFCYKIFFDSVTPPASISDYISTDFQIESLSVWTDPFPTSVNASKASCGVNAGTITCLLSSQAPQQGGIYICGAMQFAEGRTPSTKTNTAYVKQGTTLIPSNTTTLTPVPLQAPLSQAAPRVQAPGTVRAGDKWAASQAGSSTRESGTASTASLGLGWLNSDVSTLPAATGATFVRTFPTPGQYTVTGLSTSNGFTAFTNVTVTVTQPAPGCTPDANTLCLGANGRFKVQVDWQDLPNQHNGVASAHPITADTGAFWFFDSSNLELVVKVLDGTALNQHFWVFYGALSNVQYEIKVTDTHTGTVRTYTNPQGTQASSADTVAFAASAADQADAGDSLPSREPAGDLAGQTSSPSLACTTGGNNLCLDGRFLVNVAWNDVPNHRSGSGNAVSLTSTTGYDWFFADTNVELILKIVDGRGLNGHFWFFYGALSNVQYTITVTDTQTGAHKTYNNPQGTQASQADTSAF